MTLEQGFKDVLACWASGVCVVTTRDQDGMMYGLTVSSFSSLSLDPPLVLVCIDNRNRFPSMVQASAGFGVSMLHTGQEAASNYFARPGREPTSGFVEIEGTFTEMGQPVIQGALGWLACELHSAVEAGDHTIVIGRVVETFVGEGDPLLYYRRGYRTVTG